MVKRILLAMSLSICMAVFVNAKQKNVPMKSDKKEVREDSVDTIKVVNETPVKIICCIPPMPSFPGNIQQFLSDNLVWPAGRKNKKVEGRIIVKFYIERDGTCSQFKIVRSLNPDFDVEVIRVLLQMPKWVVHPLTQGGTWFTMPITFKK